MNEIVGQYPMIAVEEDYCKDVVSVNVFLWQTRTHELIFVCAMRRSGLCSQAMILIMKLESCA